MLGVSPAPTISPAALEAVSAPRGHACKFASSASMQDGVVSCFVREDENLLIRESIHPIPKQPPNLRRLHFSQHTPPPADFAGAARVVGEPLGHRVGKWIRSRRSDQLNRLPRTLRKPS